MQGERFLAGNAIRVLDPKPLSWSDLHSYRSSLRRVSSDLLSKLDTEKREINAIEAAGHKLLCNEMHRVSREFERRRLQDDLASGRVVIRDDRAVRVAELDHPGRQSEGPVWFDQKTGRQIRVLTPAQSFTGALTSDDDHDLKDVDFGRFVRAAVVGAQSESERRALSVGSDSAGGYTVPVTLAANVIDRMRAKAVVMRAGALTVPMETAELSIARLDTDPTATWHGENVLIGESNPTFGRVIFRARTLTALVKCSRELLEDSANINEALTNAFAQAMALELDRVALIGTGADPEPQGIKGRPGVGSVSMGTNGAQLTSWDKILDALQTVQTANANDLTAAILHPRTGRAINGFKDTTNQPLQRPKAVEDLPLLSSTQVRIDDLQGSASNASRITLGDFTELMVGVRSELRIDILRERFAEFHQYAFIAHLRGDIQTAHDESFCEVVGVIP